MKITRILHASVNHADAIGPTTAFYADVLGLSTAHRPDIGIPGAWLDVGDAQVHLVGFPSGDGDIDPTRHHICFGVDDIAVAKTEFDAAGVAYVSAMQNQGHRQVEQLFCVDPSGNTVELQEDRP